MRVLLSRRWYLAQVNYLWKLSESFCYLVHVPRLSLAVWISNEWWLNLDQTTSVVLQQKKFNMSVKTKSWGKVRGFLWYHIVKTDIDKLCSYCTLVGQVYSRFYLHRLCYRLNCLLIILNPLLLLFLVCGTNFQPFLPLRSWRGWMLWTVLECNRIIIWP